MNKLSVAATALTIASLVSPAAAVTFPSLTTIYVGTGVLDTGETTATGNATVFHCSNVSGVTTQVRILILSSLGSVIANTTETLNHGVTRTFATHITVAYFENYVLNPGVVRQGVVNIESLESGVFCGGVAIDAAAPAPDGVPIRLVRVNAHPGTEE